MPVRYDPIETQILDGGHLDNPRLWRRWVMAQVFRSHVNADGIQSFRKRFFQDKPYSYEWKTAEADIKAMARMSGDDAAKRSRFFNASVIVAMLDHYIENVEAVVSAMPKNMDSGGEYLAVRDFGKLYTGPDGELSHVLGHARTARRMAASSHDCRSLLAAMRRFRRYCPVSVPMPKSEAWMNAFLGSGAYYTMDNMIRFHGCVFANQDGTPRTTSESLAMLETMADAITDRRNANHELFDAMSGLIGLNQSKLAGMLAV